MTTDRLGPDGPLSTFDPAAFPLVDPIPPFSWLRPTDADVAALLTDPLHDGPDVIADDCGHVTPYGLVEPTTCGLALCGDCAAGHTCPACDRAALAGGED